MRHIARGVLALLSLAVSAGSAAALPDRGGEKDREAHIQKGEDAPLYSVVETFLLEASSWYEFPEEYPAFCSKFSIDPGWPAAKLLGIEGDRILRDYHERVQDYDPLSTRWAQDPDEWKLEELGRSFGRVFSELRSDGLRLRLKVFLRVIEMEVRPTFSTFSDQPFDKADEAKKDVRFLKAMATTSDEAAGIAVKGGM